MSTLALHAGWGPGPWIGGSVLWLLLLGTIAYLVVRALRGRGGGPRAHASAEGLLAERYARGELTEEEYRRGREVLRS